MLEGFQRGTARRESALVPMGDKDANVAQNYEQMLSTHTHSASARHPSLSCVIRQRFGCLFTSYVLVTSSQSLSISMASLECNVTGEFPHALLMSSLKLALSCIWKTSVKFFGHNTNCLKLWQCDPTGMQINTCVHARTKRRWTWWYGQLNTMHYAIQQSNCQHTSVVKFIGIWKNFRIHIYHSF